MRLTGNIEDLDYDHDSTELECGSNVRRPMNAFLIFCKRHRSLVREKYPHLENRSVTKILGELWADLEPSEKASYTTLAKQYKEAFMKANPDFKWYKLPSPPSRTPVTRPTNHRLPNLDLGHSEISAAPPCGITPGKLADETQMGGLSSLITPLTPTSPKPISKPPKKRYLENGAFRSQPPEDSVTVNQPSSSSSSSSPPSSSFDPQAANDCSALLKLAEMCSKELVRDGPNSSNNGGKPVIINGRTMEGGSGTGTPTATSGGTAPPVTTAAGSSSISATSTSSSSTKFSLSEFGKMMQQHIAEFSDGKSIPGARNNVHAFSSALPDRRSTDQSASRSGKEEEPLDLCKEKTITASHQQLINCIIDRMCRDDNQLGSSNSSGGTKHPAFPGPKMPKGSRAACDGFEVDDVDASGGVEMDDKEDVGRTDLEMDVDGERKVIGIPFKKARSARHGDGASHKFGEYAGMADGASYDKKEDLSSPRKSQRSCKGKRYQAFMSEGVLQPVKERKLSNSRKPSSSDGGEGDLSFNSSHGGALLMRTRTPSDSSESVTSRKSDRDDVLKVSKTSRSSTPTDEDTDIGHFGTGGIEASASKPKYSSDMAVEKEHARKRFKTGDFDLEEHIAALPKCNFETLDRRKQRRQASSNSSNSSRKLPVSLKEEKKLETESTMDVAFLSDDSSEKADSSSSESRGDKPVLVGSQKRKARKRSITHLDPAGGSKPNTSVVEAGVLGNLKLVALAEVATSEKRMPSTQNDSDSPSGSA